MIRLHNWTPYPVRVHLADRFGDYTETLLIVAPHSFYESDGCPPLAPLTFTIQSIAVPPVETPTKKHKKKKKHKKR